MTRRFTFLTPAFAHGAYQSQGFNRPELRAPSVKGQLRWWYDALFSDPKSEHHLFGFVSSRENSKLGLHGNESSRIIVRVQTVQADTQPVKMDFMPHKKQEGGSKNAIPVGSNYELSLIPRREPLSQLQQERLDRVLDAWLLLGAVGQRSNRGAGSIWPDDAPTAPDAYLKRARGLLAGSRLRCALLDPVYATEYELRREAGDFIYGPSIRVTRGPRDVEITESWWPFGAADDRKPSPLKLRATLLDGSLRLLALWDGRNDAAESLRKGVELLAEQKEIGRRLNPVLSELCA